MGAAIASLAAIGRLLDASMGEILVDCGWGAVCHSITCHISAVFIMIRRKPFSMGWGVLIYWGGWMFPCTLVTGPTVLRHNLMSWNYLSFCSKINHFIHYFQNKFLDKPIKFSAKHYTFCLTIHVPAKHYTSCLTIHVPAHLSKIHIA